MYVEHTYLSVKFIFYSTNKRKENAVNVTISLHCRDDGILKQKALLRLKWYVT